MERKEEFIEMWNANKSSSEMAYAFKCNNSTINIYAKRMGLPKRDIQSDCTHHFEEISAEELERRCKEVQAGWDAKTEYMRRVQRPAELCIRAVSWANNEFIGANEPAIQEPVDSVGLNKLMKESGNARQSHSGFYKESA